MPSAESKAGFTLIEMMAVMSIIALMASVAIAMTSGTGRAGLKATVMDCVALLRHERLSAVMLRSERHVSLDRGSRVLSGDNGERIAIPKDVAVDILDADKGSTESGNISVVSFHPDGASSGAALAFSRDGVVYEVRVNWYTGRVAIATR